MKTTYLITGAAGHLGGTVARQLKARGDEVRSLVLPGETADCTDLGEVFYGDVCEPDTLTGFFTLPAGRRAVVVHCAGIVDINSRENERMTRVNVQGTANVLALCREFCVHKLVYVSSVHAIPERKKGRVITETQTFDADAVTGAYAKTKAEAARLVAESDVPAIIVHPSGILGPYPADGNHLVQLVKNYLDGKLPACVKGGYDFVDVRDVADGILSAADTGRPGERYILSGGYYSIKTMLDMLAEITHGKKVGCVPLFLARLFAPILAAAAIRRGRKPLFTGYSLYTLGVNGRFSHDKATAELHYRPRELYETLRDTVSYLYSTGRCAPRKARTRAARVKKTAPGRA